MPTREEVENELCEQGAGLLLRSNDVLCFECDVRMKKRGRTYTDGRCFDCPKCGRVVFSLLYDDFMGELCQ